MFSVMALLFDFLPVLNIIGGIPTMMYLLTLILGVMGSPVSQIVEANISKSEPSSVQLKSSTETIIKAESIDRPLFVESSDNSDNQYAEKNTKENVIQSENHRELNLGTKSKLVVPLAAIIAIESFALIFIFSNLMSSKQDLRVALSEKERIVEQLKQETQARIVVENQLQSEKQARLTIEQQARSEQQARKTAEQKIQAEQDAKRAAEEKARDAQRQAQQEAEARKQAESAEAKSLAREQALTSQKNAAEIQAKRNYELSLSRIDNDFKQSQTRITEYYQRQVSLAAGRPDRISRAKEKYQDDLARAEKIYLENKARAEILYKDELTRAQRTYQQLSSSK